MRFNQVRFIVALALTAFALVAVLNAPSAVFAAERTGPVQPQALNSYTCSYFVRPGDTLYAIALRYKTGVYALAAVNGISNFNLVYAGMPLSVPCQSPWPAPNPQPVPNPPPSGICRYYTVRPGEYLSLIAYRFNLSWQSLAQFNRLASPNLVYAGMRLAIPCAGTPPPPDGTGQWQTFTSTRYHYTVNYPAGWTARVLTSIPTPGTNPEFVTLAPGGGARLPSMEIDAVTGAAPSTGYENCARNWVFRGLPACKISVPGGQIPPTEIWIFEKGNVHFRIALSASSSSPAQLFDDMMRSFQFTQ